MLSEVKKLSYALATDESDVVRIKSAVAFWAIKQACALAAPRGTALQTRQQPVDRVAG